MKRDGVGVAGGRGWVFGRVAAIAVLTTWTLVGHVIWFGCESCNPVGGWSEGIFALAGTVFAMVFVLNFQVVVLKRNAVEFVTPWRENPRTLFRWMFVLLDVGVWSFPVGAVAKAVYCTTQCDVIGDPIFVCVAAGAAIGWPLSIWIARAVSDRRETGTR